MCHVSEQRGGNGEEARPFMISSSHGNSVEGTGPAAAGCPPSNADGLCQPANELAAGAGISAQCALHLIMTARPSPRLTELVAPACLDRRRARVVPGRLDHRLRARPLRQFPRARLGSRLRLPDRRGPWRTFSRTWRDLPQPRHQRQQGGRPRVALGARHDRPQAGPAEHPDRRQRRLAQPRRRLAGSLRGDRGGVRQSIIDARTALPELRIILGEPFCLRGSATEAGWAEWQVALRRVQQIVARIAAKHQLPVVWLQQAFDDACRRAPASHWLYDGVHPLPAGHRLIADEWLRAVQGAWPR